MGFGKWFYMFFSYAAMNNFRLRILYYLYVIPVDTCSFFFFKLTLWKDKTQTCILVITTIWYLKKRQKHALEEEYLTNDAVKTVCPHEKEWIYTCTITPPPNRYKQIQCFNLNPEMPKLLQERIGFTCKVLLCKGLPE